jgi:hypothetical protein
VEAERKLLHQQWKDGRLDLWTGNDQNYWFDRKSVADVAERYQTREDPDIIHSELCTAMEVIHTKDTMDKVQAVSKGIPTVDRPTKPLPEVCYPGCDSCR